MLLPTLSQNYLLVHITAPHSHHHPPTHITTHPLTSPPTHSHHHPPTHITTHPLTSPPTHSHHHPPTHITTHPLTSPPPPSHHHHCLVPTCLNIMAQLHPDTGNSAVFSSTFGIITHQFSLGKQDNFPPWNTLGKSHKYIKYL